MGRAVSMPDIEAVAAGVAGVRAVDIRWQWHAVRQRPVVHMWIVGTPGLESTVAEQVLGISDPSLPLEVELATPIAGELEIDITVDAAYLPDVVEAGVSEALLDPVSGVLLPEAIGIGARLDRSRIFEAALSVDGAVAVRGLCLSREYPSSSSDAGELGTTLTELQLSLEGVVPDSGWTIESGQEGERLSERRYPVITVHLRDFEDLDDNARMELLDFEQFVMTLPEGYYFDIDSDRLTINGVLLNGE